MYENRYLDGFIGQAGHATRTQTHLIRRDYVRTYMCVPETHRVTANYPCYVYHRFYATSGAQKDMNPHSTNEHSSSIVFTH